MTRGGPLRLGRLWQTPLEPSTKPLSQVIWMQRSPSARWPLPQTSGQTRPALARTASSASRLASFTSKLVPAFLLNRSSALRDPSVQLPSVLSGITTDTFEMRLEQAPDVGRVHRGRRRRRIDLRFRRDRQRNLLRCLPALGLFDLTARVFDRLALASSIWRLASSAWRGPPRPASLPLRPRAPSSRRPCAVLRRARAWPAR